MKRWMSLAGWSGRSVDSPALPRRASFAARHHPRCARTPQTRRSFSTARITNPRAGTGWPWQPHA